MNVQLSFGALVMSLALTGCVHPRQEIVRDGRSDWQIVCGTGERDRLAANELVEIFEKATGVRLPVVERPSQPRHCFLVGSEFSSSRLEEEETSVVERDGNIVFAGGGIAGTCYAVYDFCEKYFGYRLYGTYPGAEIVKKTSNLVWDGKTISTKPAFTGYRISHNVPKARNEAEARFFRRNRNNAGDRPVSDRILGAQHGLFLWVPSTEKGYGSTWLDRQIGTKWEPMFEKHPEYFSLDRHGERTSRGQLCFANKDVRKLLISRFREFAEKKGPGIYMVGSNDSHNERYCWCDGCAKMMEKYHTNGGPLWDFVLELCKAVQDMKDVYVASLVYKGPEQTELAPTGIVFPENFVADLGFLNSYLPPSMMRDIALPDGRVYNHLQSIRDWKAISNHVAWWYYGGATPIQTYRRMQMELKELLAAGVDSVGSCGTGGNFEFGDIGDYMFFQLLRNPEMDADAAVMDIFRHKYGAAAQKVFDYLKELELYNINNWSNPRWGFGCDDIYEKIPLEGGDLARWQRYFDDALAIVKDDPTHLANVKVARTGLDCWSIVYANRIRQADPSFALDIDAVLARAFDACENAEKRGIVVKERNSARRSLSSMRYYANLKTDALPLELKGELPENVRLCLPEDPPYFAAERAAITNDAKAAAGVAMFGRNVDAGKPIRVQLYDSDAKEWLLPRASVDPRKLNPNNYTLVSLGTARLPRVGMLVLADKWGSSLDIRSLGRFYDPSYHEKRYEFFASLRLDGRTLFCDRVYLVDRGMPE